MINKEEVRESIEYLKTGGLGEVIGLALVSGEMGSEKVQMDVSMALALCKLAEAGLGKTEAA